MASLHHAISGIAYAHVYTMADCVLVRLPFAFTEDTAGIDEDAMGSSIALLLALVLLRLAISMLMDPTGGGRRPMAKGADGVGAYEVAMLRPNAGF